MNGIVVGWGLIGKRRADVLEKNGINVTVVIDTRKDLRAEVETYGARFYSCVDDVEDLEELDVGIVSTTHATLVPITKRLVAARVAVLVEKPGGISAKELEELHSIVLGSDVVVRFGFNHRYHPAVKRLVEIARSGELGSPMFMRAMYGHGGRRGYNKEWRAFKEHSGGGELIDQGPHLIDLSVRLLGSVNEVHGEHGCFFWDMEVEDNAFLVLRHETGCVSSLHLSCSEWKNAFEVDCYFAKGKVRIRGLGGSYGEETMEVFQMTTEMGPPNSHSQVWRERDRSWEEETLEFIRAVKHLGKDNVCKISEAIEVLRVIEKMYEKPMIKQTKPRMQELLK